MIILVSLFVCLFGALLYAFAGPKPAELGRITFAVGLFWTVYQVASVHWHVLAG
jgi:hypothetical protein